MRPTQCHVNRVLLLLIIREFRWIVKCRPNTRVIERQILVLDMRLISRNCYRKIAVGFVFSALSLSIILLLSQTPIVERSAAKDSGSAKSDKNWEWSPEKLNEFMHLLDKHKEPIDNNIMHLIQPTNTTMIIDNKLQFPSLSQYLHYINDEELALTPSYVLSHRPPSKRGNHSLCYTLLI